MSPDLANFTPFHAAIGLVGTGSGAVVIVDMPKRRERRSGSTAAFLVITILTSVTGFLFPFHYLLPSRVLGVVSLIVVGIAVYALCFRRFAGWRRVYRFGG
jgi:hypothetical protein